MSFMEKHLVSWSRNAGKGMQFGHDVADSFTEACEIAEARVRGYGIPANASVINQSTGLSIRRYTRDFDGRVSYVDGAPQ